MNGSDGVFTLSGPLVRGPCTIFCQTTLFRFSRHDIIHRLHLVAWLERNLMRYDRLFRRYCWILGGDRDSCIQEGNLGHNGCVLDRISYPLAHQGDT